MVKQISNTNVSDVIWILFDDKKRMIWGFLTERSTLIGLIECKELVRSAASWDTIWLVSWNCYQAYICRHKSMLQEIRCISNSQNKTSLHWYTILILESLFSKAGLKYGRDGMQVQVQNLPHPEQILSLSLLVIINWFHRSSKFILR